MRTLLVAALFFALGLSAEAGSGHCTFRVHVEANQRDGAVFAQPIRSLTGRDVFIEKTAWLSERDVKRYYPYRAADGSYGALLELDDHGRTVLDTLSVEHRGAILYVFLNGRPLTELQIDRRNKDGKIYLASGLTGADIKSMHKDWKLIGGRKKK
ncbi:MAG: hypothetical protein H0W66_04385 [Chthoniobacterales bacterium]|nr:hypothetical protein [Chthoniobacterales bacterium]